MSVSKTFAHKFIFEFSVVVSDVYARGVCRSWKDRVLDVELRVWGQMHSLLSVHAALAGHPLRMLSIRKECVPPPQPPSTPMPPLPPPTSPTPSTLSTQELVHSSSPFSSPFQHHQPFWLSSPVSTIYLPLLHNTNVKPPLPHPQRTVM